MSDIDRFMSKVSPEPNSGCWLWDSHIQPNGYGQFRLEGRTQYAHRAAYAIFVEEISDGLNVLHKCDNRCCVNPSHLWAGTQSDNLDDMVAKNRHPDRKGEKAIKVVLTDKEIPLIRSAIGSAREVGERFGVSGSTVWAIRNGKTWKHI